jgi:hypothetical protein
LPQLRDPQAERAEPRLEAAIAVAVAVIEPIGRALVAAGADQALDIGFHQDLQHCLRHRSKEVTLATLLQQLDKRHSVIVHRVLGGSRVKGCNFTVAHLPGDHRSLTRAGLHVIGHSARRALTAEIPPRARTLTSFSQIFAYVLT